MTRSKMISASIRTICFALAANCALAQSPSESQEIPPAPDIPVLPETEVEAVPIVNPQQFQQLPFTDSETVGPFGPVPPILNGTLFDTPPVSGYLPQSSTAGSIINIPNADLPLTVNSITRDLFNDQQALRLPDITRNAAGVNLLGDSQFFDRLLIRGQQVSSINYRKDGFLDPTQVPRDFQNVERVEILKGPASVLYGAGDAAGMINLITKKPLFEDFAEAGYTFGSFSQQRFTLDVNGIAGDGDVLIRLNIAQEDSNSYIDFDGLSRTQIAPAVTWIMSDSTTLTWTGEWHRDERLGFQGTPALGNNPLALPPNRFIGEPANDFFEGEEFRQSLVLKHEINESWVFTLGGYSLFSEVPQSTTAATSLEPDLPNPPQPYFYRIRNNAPYQDEQSHSAIANLGGEFSTGSWNHKLLVGTEYAYLDSRSNFDAELLIDGYFMGFPIPNVINVTDPVYTNPDSLFLFGLETNAFRQQRFGGYIQDLIEFNPYLKGLAGVRFDTVDFEFDRDVTISPSPSQHLETEQTFNRTSPRAGLVLQPFADESLSFYYSYSQSFSPPGGGAYFTFAPLKPVLGESHEAGIKTELIEGLSLTAAGFHTVRENDTFVLTPSLISQVGEVRSQGAEVNLLGAITEDLSIVANYCYCDSRVTDAGLGLDNTRTRNVPLHSANVWSRYNFYRDSEQIIGAALGWVYVGERPSSLIPNGIDLPGFDRWDAGLYYERTHMRVGVYLENLFDVQYAQSSVNEYQIFQGAPFNARATISFVF